MKPLLKLGFVALLIGVALEMPITVKASGQWYYCQAQEVQQCTGSATQVMSQCAYACNYGDPNGNQYCYSTSYADCEPNPDGTQAPCFPSTYTDCVQTNQPSCMSYCVNEVNDAIANCFSYYCTPE